MSLKSQGDPSMPGMSLWRQRFWPIYSYELKKFIPMVVIMFWILFNYTIVRNIKDTLLVNAPHSSSHVLPWIKIFVVTPAAILFVPIYAWLGNVVNKEKLYYGCLWFFTIFFFLFGFVLYPMHEYINASPDTVLAWKKACWAPLRDLIPAMGYWLFTVFYTMSELWGNIAVTALFWEFANQITPSQQAKRFYPIFGFWSNLGLVSAGLLLIFLEPVLESMATKLTTGESDFSTSIRVYCGFITLGGISIAAAYWWMNKNVLTDPRFYDPALVKSKKNKQKMSLGESVKFLMKSRYLGYIALLVLAYGISINLVEISWKNVIKERFDGDKKAYLAFMGQSYVTTGLITMLLIVFSQNIMRVAGWRFSAIITPWVSLITGVLFFVFLIYKEDLAGFAQNFLGTTPIVLAMWLGYAQNVLTKGAKYSLFDPTKEMAYLPLDEISKVQGKAAIDVAGGRAGKGGGSVINLVLNTAFKGHFLAFSLGICGVLVGISFIWIWAAEKLAGEYEKKLAEQANEKASV